MKTFILSILVAAAFGTLGSCGYATVFTNPDGSLTIIPITKPIVIPAK